MPLPAAETSQAAIHLVCGREREGEFPQRVALADREVLLEQATVESWLRGRIGWRHEVDAAVAARIWNAVRVDHSCGDVDEPALCGRSMKWHEGEQEGVKQVWVSCFLPYRR